MEGSTPTPKPAVGQTRTKRSFRTAKKIATPSNLLLVIAIGLAVFFGLKWHDTDNKLKHPNAEVNAAIAKAQTEETVGSVGKLIQLPSGETPTIATVSDVSKLKGQLFFANAQNGDKVLIYVKAKQAILYRPSTNKVINVAPLNLNTSTQKAR